MQVAGAIHDQVDHGARFGVIQVFLDQLGASSGIDQVVKTDARHFKLFDQVEQVGDFRGVAFVDGEAQANLEAFGLTVLHAFEGHLVGAGHGPEFVVDFFGSVQGNADIGQADFLQLSGLGLGDEGAVGGDDRAHAFGRGVFGQLDQIFADQGLAAGKEHDRRAELGQVVDDGLGLIRGDGVLVFARLHGVGVTVHAFQVAPLGHVPDHHGFFVLGELQQVGRKLGGMASVAQGVGRFHGAAVQF